MPESLLMLGVAAHDLPGPLAPSVRSSLRRRSLDEGERLADAFAEELLTDGGDIGDDEIFQVLQEIFDGSGAFLSSAGLNSGSCWNPTGPGLTAGLAAFASRPCVPRGGGFTGRPVDPTSTPCMGGSCEPTFCPMSLACG